MFIELDSIKYAEVAIEDSELVDYAATKDEKVVVITQDVTRWSSYLSKSPHKVILSNGDGSKIRGLRVNNIYVLSDSDLSYDDICDILTGFVSVTSDPIAQVEESDMQRIFDGLGIPREKQPSFCVKYQFIWNKR